MWCLLACEHLARRPPREVWRRGRAAATASGDPPPTERQQPDPQQAPPHHVSLGGGGGGGGGVGGASADHGAYIGSYTPVTRALWRSRLAGGDVPAGGSGGSGGGRVVVSLPFSRDGSLRETYANPWGFVRLGRLFEDLDSLSGTAAFAHAAARGASAAAAADAAGAAGEAPAPKAPPPKLVTASVDAIHLARPLPIGRDLTMSARVVWTGSSSLDVRMEVTQAQGADAGGADAADGADGAPRQTTTPTHASPPPPSEEGPALVALFSYVALDRATGRPAAVPPYVPRTREEEGWFEERQRVADARRRQRQRDKARRLRAAAGGGGGGGGAAGIRAPPTTGAGAAPKPDDADAHADADGRASSQAARADLMRRLAAAAARLADLPALSPPRLLPVSLTRVDNALVTQPQHRNTSGAVFGGFLMRRAFELSFAAAFLFAGCRPAFVRCDDVSFAAPVDVGDLMRFSARVLAAWRCPGGDGGAGAGGGGEGAYLVAIEAVAERARPDRRTVATTNTFRYVFRCRPDARGGAAQGELSCSAGEARRDGATPAAADGAAVRRAAAAPPGEGRPPVVLRVPIPTTAEDAERVSTFLRELSDADVAAVAAALDDAENE